ncbi:MAG: X2-like carbohydrate binding domain-containing protein [Dehalococcoidia bacterium]
MKKIFSILLSLAMLVSLGALTTAPVAAATLPSISPTSATFDLSNPAQVSTTITWGDANNITSIVKAGGAALSNGTDYVLFDTLLVFTENYLSSNLTDIGKSITLVIGFDVGFALFTVTATGTQPSINPTSTTWVIGAGAAANTTITWGTDVNSVVGIKDDASYTLIGGGTDYNAVDNGDGTGNLTITNSYLAVKLLTVGATKKLAIDFAKGNNATFTITAAAAAVPSCSPATVPYVLGSSLNISTTITWASCPIGQIKSVVDVTKLTSLITLVAGTDYSVSTTNTTLVISGPYLECQLDAASRPGRLLRVTFNDTAQTQVILNVPASGYVLPSLSSTALTYNLDQMNDPTYTYVGAIATFGTATGIAYVEDYDTDAYGIRICAKNVTPASSWLCSYVATYGGYLFLLTKAGYLNLNYPCAVMATSYLTKIGQQAKVLIHWAPGNPCVSTNASYPDRYAPTLVTVTATGTGASLSKKTADFDLDSPADVKATVSYGTHVTNVTAVKNGAAALTRGVDYVLSPDGGNATTSSNLSITASYLASVLATVGDTAALDVVFDQGDNAKLTITAVGTTYCFIATAAGANAPQLDTLRAFRDKVLRPNVPGLVSLYYKVSPSLANVIADNAALKWLVKECVVDPAACIAGWLLGCC